MVICSFAMFCFQEREAVGELLARNEVNGPTLVS